PQRGDGDRARDARRDPRADHRADGQRCGHRTPDARRTVTGAIRMSTSTAVDPVVTEVVRHGLNSSANQMKRALMRTAFSPIIYEVLDFAVALYDREIRLLAQAPSLPIFMGTLSFCVAEAVNSVGGEAKLD